MNPRGPSSLIGLGMVAAFLAGCGPALIAFGVSSGLGSDGDSSAPRFDVVVRPPAFTNETTALFSFSTNVDGLTFEGGVDGATPVPISNPFSISALADGPHHLQALAVSIDRSIVLEAPGIDWIVDTAAPSTPIDLAATSPGTGIVDVSWLASGDGDGSGIADYLLSYETDPFLRVPGIGADQGNSPIAVATATGIQLTGLSPSEFYFVRVRARDRAGNVGESSPTVCVQCGPGPFRVEFVSANDARIYPYTIHRIGPDGEPTAEVVTIRSAADLTENLTSTNPVDAIPTLPRTAQVPGGATGNQFLAIRFSRPVDRDSVLSGRAADVVRSGLGPSIAVEQIDPRNGAPQIARGRAFLGGYTYYPSPTAPTGVLQWVRAVDLDAASTIRVLDPRANGFPSGFPGADELVRPDTLVFVPDLDGDLSSPETFPEQHSIRVCIEASARDHEGDTLQFRVATATWVGNDSSPPFVVGAPSGSPRISPGGGVAGVDPASSITVQFNEPVQPSDLGDPGGAAVHTPRRAGAVSLETEHHMGQSFGWPVFVSPASPGDLTSCIVTPLFELFGSAQHLVRIDTGIRDLSGTAASASSISTAFMTGSGVGVVNAPVAPEAIYVAGTNGLSVIDLNGYGQGTNGLDPDASGNPTRSPLETHFARFNPNIGQPGVVPSLAPGSSTLDAGSDGPLTIVEDVCGEQHLLRRPTVARISGIEVGAPLDLLFNSSATNPNAGATNHRHPFVTQQTVVGNTISIPPVPNPPRLDLSPRGAVRGIDTQQPTVASSSGPFAPPVRVPPCLVSPINLLTPAMRPDFLFATLVGAFHGPQPPPGSPPPPALDCPYFVRQQIGHFLFVADRDRLEVIVVDSNRMRVFARIPQADPSAIAISPNLRVLAVANFAADTVTFIDADPLSVGFLQVLGTEAVDSGPVALAWQPQGEDLLVACRTAGMVSVIDGATRTVRRSVVSPVPAPMDIAITTRQEGFDRRSGVWFAYVLGSDGRVGLYESGPTTIGFDDFVGVLPLGPFADATAIQPDVSTLDSAIWVAHRDARAQGLLTRVGLVGGPIGELPIPAGATPGFRGRVWDVTRELGRGQMSGSSPTDFTFDELENFGAFADLQSSRSSDLSAPHSGKGQVKTRTVPIPDLVAAVRPRFVFVALTDVGAVDVFDLSSGMRVLSLAIPGVNRLTSYWKQ